MSGLKRKIYLLVGLLAFGLGSLGVALPVLPTTPFYLLASLCFSRSSERFDQWFRGTKLYQKHLSEFLDNRSMTLKQKIAINVLADGMILLSVIIAGNLHLSIVLIGLGLVKHWYFATQIKTIK